MADYFSKVTRKTADGTVETVMDLTSDTVTADNLLSGKTAHGSNGAPITGTCKYDCDTSGGSVVSADVLTGKVAYAKGKTITGSMSNNGDTSGAISTVGGTVDIPMGYTTGGTVSIDSAERDKLIAANIAQGVTVLGVTGTHEGTGKMQAKEVTASFAKQTITPDSGYTGLSSVTIKPVPYKTETNSTGGLTITIGG